MDADLQNYKLYEYIKLAEELSELSAAVLAHASALNKYSRKDINTTWADVLEELTDVKCCLYLCGMSDEQLTEEDQLTIGSISMRKTHRKYTWMRDQGVEAMVTFDGTSFSTNNVAGALKVFYDADTVSGNFDRANKRLVVTVVKKPFIDKIFIIPLNGVLKLRMVNGDVKYAIEKGADCNAENESE